MSVVVIVLRVLVASQSSLENVVLAVPRLVVPFEPIRLAASAVRALGVPRFPLVLHRLGGQLMLGRKLGNRVQQKIVRLLVGMARRSVGGGVGPLSVRQPVVHTYLTMGRKATRRRKGEPPRMQTRPKHGALGADVKAVLDAVVEA